MSIQLAVIGTGTMGSALLSEMIRQGVFRRSQVLAVDCDRIRLRRVQQTLKVRTAMTLDKGVRARVILLAVKPQDLAPVLDDCRHRLAGSPLYISIAAGIRTAALASRLGPRARVIRAMPNLPALVGCGVAGLFANRRVRGADRRLAERVFRSVGSCFWVRNESELDAVTALTGSGPAYVFGLMAAMGSAGRRLGLSPRITGRMVTATVAGAAQLLIQSRKDPATLRAQVTSKGGTTEAAFRILDRRGWQQALVDAIAAAGRRARQLGAQSLKDQRS